MDNEDDYLNIADFKLQKISDIYHDLDEKLVFFDESGNEIKVKSIKKESYNGRIYNVTVPNHIILVKGGDLITWSGNSLQRNSTNLAESSHTYTTQRVDKGGNRNSSANITSIMQLNYSHSTDSAEIEINLTVPGDEPTGDKNSTILFTGYYVTVN